MIIYALIPVFNRLAYTQAILKCLREQKNVHLRIVFVDDGSTDGTASFLAQQQDLTVLKGDGSLWWAGAMQKALHLVRRQANSGDFFIFINNDTRIAEDFVATLVEVSLAHGRAAVGSILRATESPYELLSIGPCADLWNMRTWDRLRDLSGQEREQMSETYSVDFLPGRNTIFPVEVLNRAGFLRPWLFPHYYADYEYSDRVRRAGFDLLVSTRAVTFSPDEGSSNERRYSDFWQRWFGKTSPENVLHKPVFYASVGTPAQRLTVLPRIALEYLKRVAWFPLHRGIRRLCAQIRVILWNVVFFYRGKN